MHTMFKCCVLRCLDVLHHVLILIALVNNSTAQQAKELTLRGMYRHERLRRCIGECTARCCCAAIADHIVIQQKLRAVHLY
jgi:hypothetical protein